MKNYRLLSFINTPDGHRAFNLYDFSKRAVMQGVPHQTFRQLVANNEIENVALADNRMDFICTENSTDSIPCLNGRNGVTACVYVLAKDGERYNLLDIQGRLAKMTLSEIQRAGLGDKLINATIVSNSFIRLKQGKLPVRENSASAPI